ncbi:MAG: hypothetical protein JF606_22770 [Burkholderiales bacterium]|nr:hypothetical protein [Burkholderiales bacterium]
MIKLGDGRPGHLVGPLSDAVVFTSTMAIRCMNKNAASVEAGGVRH